MPNELYGALDKCHWVPFRNDSGETVPPYAVLRITGQVVIQGDAIFTCAKPNSDQQKWYGVNGSGQVVANAIGEMTMTPQCIARYQGSSPGVGDAYGPQNNNWNLVSGEQGFFALSARTNNRSLTIMDCVQINSTAASSVSQANWAFSSHPGQSVANGATATLQWTTSGDYGSAGRDTGTYHFKGLQAGVWAHDISFSARATENASAGWEILATLTLWSSFTSLLSGSDSQIGLYHLDGGNSGDYPLRACAAFYGWIANPTLEIWGWVGVTGNADVTLGYIEQRIFYLGET